MVENTASDCKDRGNSVSGDIQISVKKIEKIFSRSQGYQVVY